MDKILELFVILEDKPGSISELTRILKKKRVSIFAIGLFIDTARLYVSHPEKALEAIQMNNYQAELREVLRIHRNNFQYYSSFVFLLPCGFNICTAHYHIKD